MQMRKLLDGQQRRQFAAHRLAKLGQVACEDDKGLASRPRLPADAALCLSRSFGPKWQIHIVMPVYRRFRSGQALVAGGGIVAALLDAKRRAFAKLVAGGGE